MNKKEIIEYRNMLYGCHVRIAQMALALHKEQERVEDLIRVLDAHIANKEE